MYHDHAIARPSQRGWFVSPAPWEKGLKFAEEALEKSLDAEVHRQENAIIAADVTAATALKSLKLRYVFFSELDFSLRTNYQQSRCGATRFRHATSDGHLG